MGKDIATTAEKPKTEKAKIIKKSERTNGGTNELAIRITLYAPAFP